MVQLKRYLDFADLLEKNGIHIPLHHCSNSAGIIRVPEANLNIVRAGITIYGIYPSEEVEKDIVMTETCNVTEESCFLREGCGAGGSGKLRWNLHDRSYYKDSDDSCWIRRWIPKNAF